MQLGVDFGTTRVVVAAADRGNYPIVTFDSPDGWGREWFPTLLAIGPEGVRSGFEALDVAHLPGWRAVRSLKRELTGCGPLDTVAGRPVGELLSCFLSDLRWALLERSNLDLASSEPLEVALAVPANAPASQRMLTMDGFRAAGFVVTRVLDEPSAAGLEYAWRRPRDAAVRRRHVAVYDLGGGTFDAAVISMSDDLHEVLGTEGVSRLGGDDFDAALLELLLAAGAIAPPADDTERDLLLEACREAKESLGPHARYVTPEVPGRSGEVRVEVADFEAAVQPLVEQSLAALDAALGQMARRKGSEVERSTVVYQVGGASQLRLVGRLLRERYGRRVWRSPYPHASVAIGLAIAAEEDYSPRILGRLTRHFGVWRERRAGSELCFDPVLAKGTPLPAPNEPPLEERRHYRAAHNVAHYRFLECSRLADDGGPAGDVSPWREVRFPLVADLREAELAGIGVERLDEEGDEIEERYTCDALGVVRVELRNLSSDYGQLVECQEARPTGASSP